MNGNSQTRRVPALDFTKGVLVLIMVLYHWLNYFIGTGIRYDVYRYLRFLTPSFIFVTGFLISSAYFAKYGVGDWRLTKRLVQRGLKILGIFILLNVVVKALIPWASGEVPIGDLAAFVITGRPMGTGAGKGLFFYVLLPIGYLLLLSGWLSSLRRFFPYVFQVAFVLFLLGIFVLSLYARDSPNLELLAIGLLGVICGYFPINRIDRVARHTLPLIVAYGFYIGAMTIWNARYPLQIVGVCLSLMLIYQLGGPGREPGTVRSHVILVGKYSLFAYIVQIAILQVLRRGLQTTHLDPAGLVMSLVAALCLTILTVEVVDRARARAGAVDRLYGAVFS